MPPAPTTSAPTTSSPVKPKRAPTAYFLFADTVRSGLMEENKKANSGKAKVSEVAKAIGDLWAKLADKEKAKFEEQAKQGKEKHAAEMQAYKEANDPASVLKEKYADLIPKKPAGAFFGYFAQDDAQRSKAEKALKDAGEEATTKKMAAELGKMWKALPEKEKALWNEKVKKAVADYEEKRKIWEATPEFAELQRVEKEQKEKAKEENEEDTTPKKEGKRKAPKDEDSSPPAKKSKVQKPAKADKPTKVAKGAKPQAPIIEPDVLKKAQSLNLEADLKNLMVRSEIAAKDFPQAKLLDELQKADGLVNKAKYALLGA